MKSNQDFVIGTIMLIKTNLSKSRKLVKNLRKEGIQTRGSKTLLMKNNKKFKQMITNSNYKAIHKKMSNKKINSQIFIIIQINLNNSTKNKMKMIKKIFFKNFLINK